MNKEQNNQRVICGDSVQELKKLNSNLIDLTITSPPYGDLRAYDGFTFNFKPLAQELFRVTKKGGVVVWVVGDHIEKGKISGTTESGESFSQALYFKELGFNLHDTMIYSKKGASLPDPTRYFQKFEYMFILSKGKPKTINLIKDRKNKSVGKPKTTHSRDEKTNEIKYYNTYITPEYGKRYNIWNINEGYMLSTTDKIAFEHPAIFPESLVQDHLLTWSNEGDLILDPFAGSGTTLKMSKLNRRNYIGIEISEKYCNIIKKRLEKYDNQTIEAFVK